MSLNLLKYIGLGILGLGGVSSVAALSSSRVRKFIGISSVISQPTPSPTDPSTLSYIPDIDSSSLSEEGRKGQFLYELSKKIFQFLKYKQKEGANKQEHLIKGLKDKFNGSLENEEDKWENFKSLCEAQNKKETQIGDVMNNEYARLCFLDKNEGDEHNFRTKGGLFNGGIKLCHHEFHKGTKSNFELGNEFHSSYPSSNPSDVFDEGLETNPEKIQDFLDVTRPIDSSIHVSICDFLGSKE